MGTIWRTIWQSLFCAAQEGTEKTVRRHVLKFIVEIYSFRHLACINFRVGEKAGSLLKSTRDFSFRFMIESRNIPNVSEFYKLISCEYRDSLILACNQIPITFPLPNRPAVEGQTRPDPTPPKTIMIQDHFDQGRPENRKCQIFRHLYFLIASENHTRFRGQTHTDTKLRLYTSQPLWGGLKTLCFTYHFQIRKCDDIKYFLLQKVYLYFPHLPFLEALNKK